MAPRVDTVATQDQVPSSADVVVIGGGIIGVTTALSLVERGISVVLVEKGRIAGEQSGRNWGWCREQLRSQAEQPIAMLAMRLWRGMSERLGADSGFRKTGMMVVSKNPEEVARWEEWQRNAAPFNLPGGILTAAEVRAKIPDTAESWTHGIWSPEDGFAEPSIAVPAMARAAMAKGLTIVQNCAARGWETENGRVSHVVTEKGTIRTGSVLVAGGAWSAMLLRAHRVRFIQSGVYGTAFRTEAAPEVFAGGVGSPLFSYRRRADGGYTVGLRGRGRVELSPMGLRETQSFLPLFFRRKSDLTLGIGPSFFNGPFAWRRWSLDARSPFERAGARIYDPAADPKLVAGGLSAFVAAYPRLKGLKVAESWGGLVDATPDMVPVIDRVPGQEGVFLAAGFSGHGFALGPGAGWVLAKMITGETPEIDMHPFRFGRFQDGTSNAVHHWI